MSGFPGDFHVSFSNGKVQKYNGFFEFLADGVLHVVSTADNGKHFWFSPSGWLSIEKMTPP